MFFATKKEQDLRLQQDIFEGFDCFEFNPPAVVSNTPWFHNHWLLLWFLVNNKYQLTIMFPFHLWKFSPTNHYHCHKNQTNSTDVVTFRVVIFKIMRSTLWKTAMFSNLLFSSSHVSLLHAFFLFCLSDCFHFHFLIISTSTCETKVTDSKSFIHGSNP